MPREYRVQAGTPGPSPLSFGSQDINLQSPRFVAQTAVDPGVNVFAELQQILQSATGVASGFLKYQTNLVNDKVATQEAIYRADQRKKALENQMMRDADEKREIDRARINSLVNSAFLGEQFDDARAIIAKESESFKGDFKMESFLSELSLETASREKTAAAQRKTPQEIGMKVDLVRSANLTIANLEEQANAAVLNGELPPIRRLENENYTAAIMRTIRDGWNSSGIDLNLIEPQDVIEIEASILGRIDGLRNAYLRAENSVKDVRDTQDLIQRSAEIGVTAASGDPTSWQDYKEALNVRLDKGMSQQQYETLMRRGASSYWSNVFKNEPGFSGVMKARAHFNQALADGSLSDTEARVADAQLIIRGKDVIKKTVDRLTQLEQAKDPTNEYFLAGSALPPSQLVLKELGIEDPEIVNEYGMLDDLSRADARWASHRTGIERRLETDKRAEDISTVLGLDTRVNNAMTETERGNPKASEALLKDLEQMSEIHKDNPKMLYEISQARLRLQGDVTAFRKAEQRQINEVLDEFDREYENVRKQLIADEKAADREKRLTELENRRTKTAGIRTLVNDTFTEAYTIESEDGRKMAFDAALIKIRELRTDENDPKIVETLSLAEKRLSMAKNKKALTSDAKRRYSSTEASDVWKAAERLAKEVSPQASHSIYDTAFDNLHRMGAYTPDAARYLEKQLVEGEDPVRVYRHMMATGVLNSAGVNTDMFTESSPIAFTASMLTATDAAVAAKTGNAFNEAEAMARNVAKATEMRKRRVNAFAITPSEDVGAFSPLKFKEQLKSGLQNFRTKTYFLGIFPNTIGTDPFDRELDINSFTPSDQALFNAYYGDAVMAGSDVETSINFAINSMKSRGWTAIPVGETKVDFVFDPYGVVPEPYAFVSSSSKDYAKAIALRAMKETGVVGQDVLTVTSTEGMDIEFTFDDRYIRAEDGSGGVPFNIILPNGRRINYYDFPEGKVPVVGRRGYEQWTRQKIGSSLPLVPAR